MDILMIEIVWPDGREELFPVTKDMLAGFLVNTELVAAKRSGKIRDYHIGETRLLRRDEFLDLLIGKERVSSSGDIE